VVRELRAPVIFVLCVATSACGSGRGAGTNVDGAVTGISCDPFAACGGNIVGTWRVVVACGSVSSPACPSSERITANTSHTQTTYTFAGDGTFTATSAGDATEALLYPLACLGAITDAGIPHACADVERRFVTPTQTGDAGTPIVELTSASCSAAGSETCACTLVLRYTGPLTTSGTYATSGNQLTLVDRPADGGVPDAGADPVSEYCVSGNTLTIHSVSNTTEVVMTLTR
jgi:hypothetical protein